MASTNRRSQVTKNVLRCEDGLTHNELYLLVIILTRSEFLTHLVVTSDQSRSEPLANLLVANLRFATHKVGIAEQVRE